MKGSVTSEAVSLGHPDKVADQISDAVLDSCLSQDPESRVACETLCTTDTVVVAGEISTHAEVDVDSIVRRVVRDIGYEFEGFDYNTLKVVSLIHTQSPDIAQGVDQTESHEQGAGDQGMMFGYAEGSSDTCYMPIPICYAHLIMRMSEEARRSFDFGKRYLRPDAKTQLTFNESGLLETVVLSHQHTEDMLYDEFTRFWKDVVRSIVPSSLVSDNVRWLFNPTGRFVEGGPSADTGLTGRKIIADTYGGFAHHGGGAFSGKDPSKVDRSAAYMCRLAAKSAVASGLCRKCEVSVAYAIGVAQPVSILVDSFGTGDDSLIADKIKQEFDFRPKAIIDRLGLKTPTGWRYEQTAQCGHFGWEIFPWEKEVSL